MGMLERWLAPCSTSSQVPLPRPSISLKLESSHGSGMALVRMKPCHPELIEVLEDDADQGAGEEDEDDEEGISGL